MFAALFVIALFWDTHRLAAIAGVAGVFATRSPHRPNPIGLHEVGVTAIDTLSGRAGGGGRKPDLRQAGFFERSRALFRRTPAIGASCTRKRA